MKRFFLFFIASVWGMFLCVAGPVMIGDAMCEMDTLERYQVGPGTWYTRMDLHFTATRRVHLYMLEADLSNPYMTLEARNGGGSVGQNELMLHAHQVLDSAGHRPVAGVNCNFFWTPSTTDEGLGYQPTGGTAHDGLLMTEPDSWLIWVTQVDDPRWRDLGYVLMDTAGRAIMEQMLWDGKIMLPGNSASLDGQETERTYPLRDCNRYRTNPKKDEIALFNYGLGPLTRTIDASVTELVFTSPEWVINGDMTCTVQSVNHTGGTRLQRGEGCLQARGTGAEFISGLQPGDTFRINLGLYCPHNGMRPAIKEMVMGKSLCMVDSVLTVSNEIDTYNTQIYARTGLATNSAGDRLWMMVMETPGTTTTEMCQVFQASGASYACGMDGGGSAQMELLGEHVNRTTEATPRAVNTMLFAMSTAPDDDAVARLAFFDQRSAVVPAFCAYTPRICAYNQYGVLLSSDWQDYTLTCEPASLGSVSADGRTFTASGVGGTGYLVAHRGDVMVRLPLTVEPGEVLMRLDSILIDNRDYRIETYAIRDGAQFDVDPSVLSWRVEDRMVAEVTSDGTLRGLSNGSTQLVGSLGEGAEMTANVMVEIPTDSMVSSTEISSCAQRWDLQSNYGPIAWVQDSVCSSTFAFTVNSVRSPRVAMTGDLRLFALPDSIQIELSSTAAIKQITWTLQAANQSGPQKVVINGPLAAGEPHTIVVRPEDMGCSSADIATYPLRLQQLLFTLQDVKLDTEYRIMLHSLTLCYGHYQLPVTDAIFTESAEPVAYKMLRDGRVVIVRDGVEYSVLGQRN